jgi:hypothetical protein
MMSVCHKKDAARTYKIRPRFSETIRNWFSETETIRIYKKPEHAWKLYTHTHARTHAPQFLWFFIHWSDSSVASPVPLGRHLAGGGGQQLIVVGHATAEADVASVFGQQEG